jgi:Domain of unkown function (DUF1775)
MKAFPSSGLLTIVIATLVIPKPSWGHVTLQTTQTLRPTGGYGTVTLNVPNERHVDNTKVTLTVPDAFRKAGGRINRIQYPTGWTVVLEKAEKPPDIYKKEQDERAKKDASKEAAGAEQPAKKDEDEQERKAMEEMRRKWITKVTFEGGAIPPDGFAQFLLSLQLPEEAGKYRFPAVQTYADGKEVSWSELVDGADHPAPTLNVDSEPWISFSDLPLLFSALALLVACTAYFKPFRAAKVAKAAGAALVPGWASASGDRRE